MVVGGVVALGVELTVEEVLEVAKRVGFRVERRESGAKGEYIGSGEGMLRWIYESEFWVAVKISRDAAGEEDCHPCEGG